MIAAVLGSLSFCLFWLMFRDAGVNNADTALVLAILGLTCAAYAAWGYRASNTERLPRTTCILMGAILMWIGLQVVPLPIDWVRALSPARAAVVERPG